MVPSCLLLGVRWILSTRNKQIHALLSIKWYSCHVIPCDAPTHQPLPFPLWDFTFPGGGEFRWMSPVEFSEPNKTNRHVIYVPSDLLLTVTRFRAADFHLLSPPKPLNHRLQVRLASYEISLSSSSPALRVRSSQMRPLALKCVRCYLAASQDSNRMFDLCSPCRFFIHRRLMWRSLVMALLNITVIRVLCWPCVRVSITKHRRNVDFLCLRFHMRTKSLSFILILDLLTLFFTQLEILSRSSGVQETETWGGLLCHFVHNIRSSRYFASRYGTANNVARFGHYNQRYYRGLGWSISGSCVSFPRRAIWHSGWGEVDETVAVI